MKIFIDLNRMKRLSDEILFLQNKLNIIKDSFIALEYKLENSSNFLSVLKNIENDLKELSNDFYKCKATLDYAISNYSDLERKIEILSSKSSDQYLNTNEHKKALGLKQCVDFNKSDSDVRQTILLKSDISILNLPDKNLITKGTVKSGVISNGKNILIRSLNLD